jgi:hypothetical protein
MHAACAARASSSHNQHLVGPNELTTPTRSAPVAPPKVEAPVAVLGPRYTRCLFEYILPYMKLNSVSITQTNLSSAYYELDS